MVSLVANVFSAIIRFSKMSACLLKSSVSINRSHHIVLQREDIKHYRQIFVIGDVHGCYDEMQSLLSIADVNDQNTLKIFVGDLINKGPKSLEVLDAFMRMPSAMSVRGNHEEVVLREIKTLLKNPKYELSDENQWMKEIRSDGLNCLNNLPYTITIPELNCIFVHAGLVPHKKLSEQELTHMVSMRNLTKEEGQGECFYQVTKNDKVGIPWASAWNGPEHVYFGHDAKRLIQTYPLATGLDSGCVYGKKLSGIFIFGPQKGKMVSVDAKKMYQVPIEKSSKGSTQQTQ